MTQLRHSYEQVTMTASAPSRQLETLSPEAVFECMGDGIVVLDRQARVTLANTVMAKMVARPPHTLRGVAFEQLLAEAELLRVVGVTQLLESRSVEHMQIVFTDTRGGFIPASVTASPLVDSQGRTQGCVLVCRDNREVQELLNESSRWAAAEIERADRLAAAKSAAEAREQAQRELGQAQKLESIGQLAAGIAHEINTPIQFIGDNVGFLQKAFEALAPFVRMVERFCHDDAPLPDRTEMLHMLQQARTSFLLSEVPSAIEQTTEGISHVSKIVRAMKEFSHPSSAEKRALDIHHAIENTVTVARNEWKYVAELETHFDTSMPLIPCHPDGFNQAILNVVVNAAHAIAESTRRYPEGKGLIRIRTRHAPPFAEIAIEDNGTGIPDAHLQRIFDPFFTTKEVGKGTGQGLALTYAAVVKKHGGDIEVRSTQGTGTTFFLRFPLLDPSQLPKP